MNEMPRKSATAEGEFVQIKKIGNSLGLILSKDILSRLKLSEGDKLHIVEQPDGSGGSSSRRTTRSTRKDDGNRPARSMQRLTADTLQAALAK
jgi:putative addiction module antidote